MVRLLYQFWLFSLAFTVIDAKKRFTWQSFRSLSSKSIRGIWLDSESYIYKQGDSLILYNSTTTLNSTYYKNEELSGANDWSLSGSGQHVLIARERKSGYADRFQMPTTKLKVLRPAN